METTLNIQYNKEALVVQANELIRSKQDEFTLLEAKLIRLAIAQILMEDTDLKTYNCNATELANYLGIPKGNVYRELGTIAKNLMNKVIKIEDKKSKPKANGEYSYKLFHWVDYYEYNNGMITLKLSESLKPYLLGLNELFTEYGYNSILALPTTNSIRLLELLKSYENLANTYSPNFAATNPYPEVEKADNELIFTIDYLKEFFNCTDKYTNNRGFITRVIEASVRAINEKSPTHKVSFRIVKEGRSIAYVLFKINAWEDKDFMDFIS